MGDSLVKFLDALSEPVVQYSYYGMALRCETREDAYRVVDCLDPIVSLSHPFDQSDRTDELD